MLRFFAMIAVLLAGATPARGQGLFEQGQNRLSFYLGSTVSGDDSYILAGLGFGHFILDGLELGLQADYWFGGDPSVARVAPEVRYIVPTETIAPYAGVFYRHWFIGADDYEDVDTAGGRLGLIYDSGGAFYLGGGAVYEQVLGGCDGDDCSYIYPEINIALIF